MADGDRRHAEGLGAPCVDDRERKMNESSTIEQVGFVKSADSLHEAARKAAGCADFGDPAYLDGFRVLLEAYDRESHLTHTGRALVETQLLGILKNRLTVQKAWTQTPAILRTDIRRPIFILGLPRTGTTALHHLLWQDPGNQVLDYWLAAAPSARPPRSDWDGDPRFQRAMQELDYMYTVDPTLKTIHLMTAGGPDECRHLLQQTFTDDTFECNATIPGYAAWYASRDMRPSYAQHRDVLKLIGSPTPHRRWVLKYPAHMRHLAAVLDVYPDACVVQTHRDPSRVLPSLCSLIAGWRGLYEDHPDRRAIAAWQLGVWAQAMEHALQVRGERDAKRFFDLSFREVVADPVGAVQRMYVHFGFDFTDDAERRMRAWHAANPRDKHGEHRYSAEEFGLTTDAMRDRFAAYMKHFQVDQERGG